MSALDRVIECIEKARLGVNAHHIVQIVAVSKYSTEAEVSKLYTMGQRCFGENRVQDLEQKSDALKEFPLEWHFIGSLQKNKINKLIDLNPMLMHSIDSLELALALNKRLEVKGKTMRALLQVNSAYEESKSGVMPEQTLDTFAQIKAECSHINLQGLMSIGAHSDDQKTIQKSFETTQSLYEKLDDVSILSMGMSGDYELAIACGSNLVRLGSVLFKG